MCLETACRIRTYGRTPQRCRSTSHTRRLVGRTMDSPTGAVLLEFSARLGVGPSDGQARHKRPARRPGRLANRRCARILASHVGGGANMTRPSIRRFRQAGPVAWSVSSLGVGGSTSGGVPSAGTSDVATIRPAGTRPRMRTRRVIRSSIASSQVRIGLGATKQTSTRKALDSRRRSIIPSTNPCLDQPERSPPTGKSFWWSRDDATGGDRR